MRHLRLSLTGLLLLCFFGAVNAQQEKKFVFRNNLSDTLGEKINPGEISSHYLGQAMAIKYHRFTSIYTYLSSASATSRTETTKINKPTIYYAVKKLNRYYRKQLRKDKIEEPEAFDQLAHILDVAYVIYNQDTEELEEALRQARKPEKISDVFDNTVLK